MQSNVPLTQSVHEIVCNSDVYVGYRQHMIACDLVGFESFSITVYLQIPAMTAPVEL